MDIGVSSWENLSLGFSTCHQVRLKPACSATETNWRLDISDLETRGIILSRQRTTKCWSDCEDVQADLRLCCSHMEKNRFSHDVAHWRLCGHTDYVDTQVDLSLCCTHISYGPHQGNLVLIAYASSEGSGEPAHPRSLARTSAARSYRQWVKRNLQTESQIPSPSEWLGMHS